MPKPNPPADLTTDVESEQGREKLLADRRRKLEHLRTEFDVDPYGQRVDGIVNLAQAREQYDETADAMVRETEAAIKEAKKAGQPEEEWPVVVDDRPVVRVAGRVVQQRIMGNLIFLRLRDDSGDIQIAISKKLVGQPTFSIAKQTDLSDIVSVTGPLGMTNTGELSVWATRTPAEESDPDPLKPGFLFLTKSLALPPGKFHGLTDQETRYRKRYVDLYTSPEVMETMKMRIRIIDEMRDYLRGKGFIEVETPMLQSMHGGAAARPFETHHNALDIPLTLRIAPELYLKRLLVGGMTKVFEINRNFRNEGVSPRHNPEFTMLEAYEAYGSWETMADLVEDMVCTIALKLFGTLKIQHGLPASAGSAADGDGDGEGIHRRGAEGAEECAGDETDNAKTAIRQDAKRTINLERPWRRVSMADLVEEHTGWKFKKAKASADDIQQLIDASILRSVKLFANSVRAESAELAELMDSIETVTQFKAVKDSVTALATNSIMILEEGVKRHNEGRINLSEEKLKAGEFCLKIYYSLLSKVKQFADQHRRDEFIYHLLQLSPAEQLTEVYEKLIEPTLIDPTFVTRVPSVIIPLAKKCADDPFFADVYELAINGVEISPGYSELNDPQVQEANFRTQVGDEAEQQQVDEDFLEALRVGMPPAGGIGLGIDRLVMMLTGATSIRDVILFPLMRPAGDK